MDEAPVFTLEHAEKIHSMCIALLCQSDDFDSLLAASLLTGVQVEVFKKAPAAIRMTPWGGLVVSYGPLLKLMLQGLDRQQRAEVLVYVAKHEIYHAVLQHLLVFRELCKKYGAEVARVAADCAIDDLLPAPASVAEWLACVNVKAALKTAGLLPPKGSTVEAYCEAISQIVEKIRKMLDGIEKRAGLGQGGSELGDEEDNEGSGQGYSEGEGSGWRGYNPIPGEDISEHSKPEALERFAQQVEEHVKQLRQRGLHPGDLSEWIDKLTKPKPTPLPILQNAIATSRFHPTYTRPNRRRGYGYPGLRKDRVESDVIIAYDTSGSVGTDELRLSVGKVVEILERIEGSVVVIQFDADIQSIAQMQRPQLQKLDSWLRSIKGRGGTDIKPVLEWWAHNKPSHRLIVITDGYLEPPEPSSKITWLIIDPEQARNYKAMGHRVFYVEPDEPAKARRRG